VLFSTACHSQAIQAAPDEIEAPCSPALFVQVCVREPAVLNHVQQSRTHSEPMRLKAEAADLMILL